ncbi:glutamate-1-semialdehyde 2,1-aminomutase [Abditibacterium utsteinense]|uniref:Glutamate-1-semialdehyde 2,1-aminomutase n=1 Tax=Abditibacterium utsteinense TaxID=1960156 RepID=A0A2S8SXH2_9BACT|nr:glutamate-1-semialdehyde 2,1-aminomutase [Abditibacterium utsteinense]PQV65449.1 glutamate-1-semialdehyde 2,1-aminomutase [Abditibacterium utsteinense]
MITTRSDLLFSQSQTLMPGGVNSPVRAFGSVGGTPRFIARGQGAHFWDEDGNRYLDYVGSWGPLIHGHAPAIIHDAVRAQLELGTSFGAPTALEVEMARHVIESVPSIEMVRMVNSGTEAVMGALRAARGFTGRKKIIKFAGCYHGHADALLVQAGSGAMTLGVPDSAGVTPAQTIDTISAHYNAIDETRALIRELGDSLALVVVEPLPANMGLVKPKAGFLEMLREETTKNEAILLFDEVMTGFRLAKGGFQEVVGIAPDMTTLGKIIGGGFPVGAYGGKREIMECVAPSGPVYQAGTLSGNPMAMTAGLASLRALTPEKYQRLETLGARLESGIRDALQKTGTNAQLQRWGSMWTLFFSPVPVEDYEGAKRSDTAKFGRFFHAMLNRGFYLPPSQFEAAFISLAHTERDIDDTVEAIHESLSEI